MPTTVSIRLWRPEGWTSDGDMFVKPEYLEWQQVNYLRPDQCGHQGTICRTCMETWELDWEIDLDTIEDLEASSGQADADDDVDLFEQVGYAAGPSWDDEDVQDDGVE